MSCFQMIYPSYAAPAAYLPYYSHHDYRRLPFSADEYHEWSPKRGAATKACYASTSAEMPTMTSSCDVTAVALQPRGRDVTELPVTSVRRCDDTGEQASVDADCRQQQQQPTSRQYMSETCVLLTYFTGDIQSNVDQHFARALSQPTSFGPDYRGTTPPSVRAGVSPHCTAWLDSLQRELHAQTRDMSSTLSDDVMQSVAAADVVTSLTSSPWSTAYMTTALTRNAVSLPINASQFDDHPPPPPHHHQQRHRHHHHPRDRDERDRLSLAASFASHLPYSSLLQQRHLQLQRYRHHHHEQQLTMTSVMMQTPVTQWSRDNMAPFDATLCSSVHGRSSFLVSSGPVWSKRAR